MSTRNCWASTSRGRTFTILTFAPELPGALELTHMLRQHGIVAAAGHSTAQEKHVLPAIDAGLRHCIHLWSAQSTTVREGPWRRPGLLEVSLTDTRLVAARKDSLEADKDADIAIFDPGFRAWRTLLGGRWVDEVGSET